MNQLFYFINSQHIPGPYVICTDSNGHHPVCGSNSPNQRGNIFYDWFQESNLYLLNNSSPTFESSHGTFTNIDLTLCSYSLAVELDWRVLEENYTSDHFPILISNHDNPSTPTVSSLKFVLNKANWQKFNEKLILPAPPYESPNKTFKNLLEAIDKATELTIPKTKTSSNNKYNKFWWNEECSLALKAKKKHIEHIKET